MARIVGSGCVSAAGIGRSSSWLNYTSGQKNWSVDPSTGLPVYPVASLPDDVDIREFTSERTVDRTSLLALHAARQAVTEAGWEGADFAILVGCSRGPTQSWEATFTTYSETGKPPIKTSPSTTLGSIGFALADFFGTTSVADGLSVTCSSGFHALLHGVALLKSGMVDRVLVGGTEAPLTDFTLRQMKALRVYASPDEKETFACRPLAPLPSGMVVGEGAGFLALELEKNKRKPTLLGLGFARERNRSSTGISRDGLALQTAMRKAAESVIPDLIITHAPGTKRGDAAELAAIKTVFGGGEGDHPPITSLKYATGHAFGASGPLAAVAGLSMLEQGAVFPPYLKFGAVPKPRSILINATGFGGNAVSILLGSGNVN